MDTVVIVDDEDKILRALERELRDQSRVIKTFSDVLVAAEYVASEQVDLVLSDYRMPNADGVSFLQVVKGLKPDSVRIIMSGVSDRSFLESAINDASIYRFIAKPWDSQELCEVVEASLKNKKLSDIDHEILDKQRPSREALIQKHQDIRDLEKSDPDILQIDLDEGGAIVIEEKDL